MVFMRPVGFNAVFSCHFDHGFIGFRARILIKDLVHSNGRTDLFRQKRLRYGIRIIEHLHQRSCLLLNRLHDLLIAVANGIDSNTCVEIEIRCVLFVIQIHTLCVVGNHVEPFIGFDHVLLCFLFEQLCCQTGVTEFHKTISL